MPCFLACNCSDVLPQVLRFAASHPAARQACAALWRLLQSSTSLQHSFAQCVSSTQGRNGGDASPKAQPKRRASLARAASKKDAKTRVVHLNDGQPAGEFVGNGIKTAKYNILTFLPLFLWEMFSRAAYAYFLIQARASAPREHCRSCSALRISAVLCGARPCACLGCCLLDQAGLCCGWLVHAALAAHQRPGDQV